MWKPRPDEGAPAVVFLNLAWAAVLALAAWKMQSDSALIWLPSLALVLLAFWELIRYFLKKRAAAKYDEGVRSGEITAEQVETDELRRMKVIAIGWMIGGGLFCASILNKLLKDSLWVSTAVYYGLIALACFAVGIHQFRAYKKRRASWKEE